MKRKYKYRYFKVYLPIDDVSIKCERFQTAIKRIKEKYANLLFDNGIWMTISDDGYNMKLCFRENKV